MRRRAPIVAVALVILGFGSLSFGAQRASAACGAATSVQNGGFEVPPVPAGTYVHPPQAEVPPWQTTDSLGEIEVWGDGFLGVPAAVGNGFAELNANSAGTLYQDVVSVPGDTWTWSLMHRARVGVDSMEVLIGDAAVADVTSDTGWNYVSDPLADDTTAWGTHTATYNVPTGQTCTRLAFRTVSTGSGDDSVGNFLDEVSFAISANPTPSPTPTPTPAPTSTSTPQPSGAASAIVTAPPTETVDPPTRGNSLPTVPIVAVSVLFMAMSLLVVARRVERRR